MNRSATTAESCPSKCGRVVGWLGELTPLDEHAVRGNPDFWVRAGDAFWIGIDCYASGPPHIPDTAGRRSPTRRGDVFDLHSLTGQTCGHATPTRVSGYGSGPYGGKFAEESFRPASCRDTRIIRSPRKGGAGHPLRRRLAARTTDPRDDEERWRCRWRPSTSRR